MSTPKNDGGPAFPAIKQGPVGTVVVMSEGMTLRDWFAGQVLAGMLANERYPDMTPAECAVVAYSQADAMLAARDPQGRHKPEGKQ